MPTRVYVDGFNLYNGMLKGHGVGIKWLDLVRLGGAIMPRERIDRVWYFTARVQPTERDPTMATRQDVYLRALSAHGGVDIMEGQFVRRPRRKRLWDPPHTRVTIEHVEEKGSDVNLASMLIHDAAQGRFNKALVISDDSDLTEAVRLVVGSYGLFVMVACPHRDRTTNQALTSVASAVTKVYEGTARRCQLPDIVHEASGRAIHRPEGW